MTDKECRHLITQGRKGEEGSWCIDCGVKAYAVDARKCQNCLHYRRLLTGSICEKHLMAVIPEMRVTYKIAKGTCWGSVALESVCANGAPTDAPIAIK